jgi:hypothetical protein
MKGLRDPMIAITLSLTYAAQAALVLHQQQASIYNSGRFILGAIVISAAAGLAWMAREWLNPHADMLVLMGGFGGLGMLLGNIADGVPSCHLGSLHFFSWMNGGMAIGGLLPAIAWSRCLLAARQAGRLRFVVAVDSTGMWLGMAFPHWMVSVLPLAPSFLGIWAHPLMLGAMLAGMAIAMTFSSAGLKVSSTSGSQWDGRLSTSGWK